MFKKPVIKLARSRQLQKNKMAYILVCNKSYLTQSGRRTYIIYIGTTSQGAGRPAASAVNKASRFYKDFGVKMIDVYVVTCQGQKNIRSWERLEAGLINAFWNIYHQMPKHNKKRPTYIDGTFSAKALEKIIRTLPEASV